MSDLLERLDAIKGKLGNEDFLNNKGLSNEVGIHVFCYEPKDEMVVRDFIAKLKTENNIIEQDLYEIFLEILKEKKVEPQIDKIEQTKGKEYLLSQLQKVVTADVIVQKMNFTSTAKDVIILTGIEKVFPFMRVHKVLDSMQPIFGNTPIIVFYPGEFNGKDLSLFGKLNDGNYYRAFNLV